MTGSFKLLTRALAKTKQKEKSHRTLLYLILLMFTLQTIHNADTWYRDWVAFIKDDGKPKDELLVMENIETTRVLYATGTLEDLLTALRLAIADSIIVSPNAHVV
jgi:hypothetical protein